MRSCTVPSFALHLQLLLIIINTRRWLGSMRTALREWQRGIERSRERERERGSDRKTESGRETEKEKESAACKLICGAIKSVEKMDFPRNKKIMLKWVIYGNSFVLWAKEMKFDSFFSIFVIALSLYRVDLCSPSSHLLSPTPLHISKCLMCIRMFLHLHTLACEEVSTITHILHKAPYYMAREKNEWNAWFFSLLSSTEENCV